MMPRTRDPFVAIPSTLNAAVHKDYNHLYLEVYFSIASRAGNDVKKSNFWTCYPSIAEIAAKCGLTPQQVKEATPWLQDNAYLFFERRPSESHLYTLIQFRDLFIETRKTQGFEKAKELCKVWIENYGAGRLR